MEDCLSANDDRAFSRTVGERLQMYRRRKGLTQEALATHLGVPRATYANVELGRQRVHLDLIWKAAAMLEVPIARFVPDAPAETVVSVHLEPQYNTTGAFRSLKWLLEWNEERTFDVRP
jgi:transcriptional regulator with XRE-family HTH domain